MEALSALPTFMHLSQTRPAAKAAATAEEGRDPRAWEAAKEFEAQFVSTLFQSMFKGLEDQESAFGGGPGEPMFSSLLVDQYGQQMTKSGGIGLADSVYREMLKMQEVSQ
jgi:Rod binding domain-containing protein